MKIEKKEMLESFYKAIKSQLLCSNAEKEELLFGLRSDMEEYLDDHPDLTMEELHNHFGKPADIANSYQFSIGEEEARKRMKKKKQLWYVLAFGIAILIVVGLILLAIFMTKATDKLPDYYFSVESSVEQLNSIPQNMLNEPEIITV